MFLVAGVTSAQEHRSITLPFRSVSSLIFIDVKVNGKPAVRLLDTGANVTVLRNAGTQNPMSLELKPHYVVAVKAMDLGKLQFIALKMGNLPRIDGILGEDVLRSFASVRIDYRTHTSACAVVGD